MNTAQSVLAWLRQHVLNTWLNALLSLGLCVGLAWGGWALGVWIFAEAQWHAVGTNLRLFTIGLYPSEQSWRPGALLLLLACLFGGSAARGGMARSIALGLLVSFCSLLVLVPGVARVFMGGAACTLLLGYGLNRLSPLLAQRWSLGWWLSLPLVLVGLGGWPWLGLAAVSTAQWGGFMLTLLLASVSIAASFPLGLALALGRQSSLPVIRWFSIAYIELVRGVPLVSVLMMFALLLPLFLPTGLGRPDMLLRIGVGMTLFAAAYVAEDVRGGLQAIPKGQYEAATALGFTWVQSMRYIILPQALRAVVPALVGQSISLFKDTSLATIVGLLELLGIAKSVIEQPEWKAVTGGVVFEVFTFTAMIYLVCNTVMSRLSRRLETTLGGGIR